MTRHRPATPHPVRLTRLVAALLAVAVATLVTGVSSAGAGGRPGHGHPSPRAYLALGDSISFGYSPALEDPWIPSQFVGYPEEIGRRTGLDVTNLSCPGRTSQAIVSATADGCSEMRDMFARDGLPFLHTDYDGTQLSAAVDAVRSPTPPSLISIQVGGNDLDLCTDPFPDPGPQQSRCLDRAMSQLAGNIGRTVDRLRRAGSRADIVIVGYYLVPGLEDLVAQVNRAARRAARDQHVAFAEVASPFDRYARRHGGDLCSAGLLIMAPDGTCDLHPTPVGRNLLADAVLDAATR